MDRATALAEQVRDAHAAGRALRIVGGGSKAFYGEAAVGEALEVAGHAGIVSHAPSELVVTARCGTPVAELEAVLAAAGQHLPFEPPRFAGGPMQGGTVGGMVAAGLCGPSRMRAGSVRDHLLGARVLDGRGELLSFGGTVIKNVAGYDVSRVHCGALGTLGVLLEVSLKVLPLPPAEATLVLACGEAEATSRVNRWWAQALPVDASAWVGDVLTVRLRGARAAVSAAAAGIGGMALDADAASAFWHGLRDHADPWFDPGRQPPGHALWRLAVPATTPPLGLGDTLVEWAGAQRWVKAPATDAARLRAAATAVGGHATLFRGADKSCGVFTPLAAPIAAIHARLKTAFDPARILERGRLYPTL